MTLADLKRDKRYKGDWHRYCVADERWSKIWTLWEKEAWIKARSEASEKGKRGEEAKAKR